MARALVKNITQDIGNEVSSLDSLAVSYITVPFTTIVNRAQIPDLANSLGPMMAINRTQIQQIYQIQNEFGPNNEPVWGAVNDAYGQIRFVGKWSNNLDSLGAYVGANFDSTSYAEITFYGTGLNALSLQGTSTQQHEVSIDGGAYGANVFPVMSQVLNLRNYAENLVINYASGLSLGMHTIRVRNSNASNILSLYGFEVLNEQFLTTTANTNSNNQLTSVANTTGLAVGMDITGAGIPANTTISLISGSTITMSASATATAVGVTVKFGNNFIKVNPGSQYYTGNKLTLSSQHLSAYNSGFESGALGSRGGRVAIYQKADGSIAKAINPTGSQLNLTAADHSNEESARIYNLQEFSASRNDDWQFVNGNSETDRGFTLDDGTATLVGKGMQMLNTTTPVTYSIGGSVLNLFITFTFVGTGCDLTAFDTGASLETMTVSVDGTSIGTLSSIGIANTIRTRKLVSGLPYGTHTLKIQRTAVAGGATMRMISFTVYQPKTPTLPTGAKQVGAYNIMADYVANTTAGAEFIATGILRKTSERELVYVGTYNTLLQVGSGTAGSTSGWYVNGTTGGNNFQYTFWGTGLDLRVIIPGGVSANATITINNNAGAGFQTPTAAGATTSGFYGGVTAFSLATGIYTTNTANNFASGVWLNGLPLGLHTVKVAYNSGSAFGPEAIDVITPIHSYKNNGPFVLQNTLAVGSQGIEDSRLLPSQVNSKNVVQARGIANITFNSSTYVPIADLSATIKTSGGLIDVSAYYSAYATGAHDLYMQIYIDGIATGVTGFMQTVAGSTNPQQATVEGSFYVSPGIHKVDIFYFVAAATVVNVYLDRALIVKENK